MYSSDGSKLVGGGRTYVAGWLVACRGGIVVTPGVKVTPGVTWPSSKVAPRLASAPSTEMLLNQSWNQTTTLVANEEAVLVPLSIALSITTPALTVLEARAFCSVVLARCRALQNYDAMLGLGVPFMWRVAFCLDFFVPRDCGEIAGSLIVVDCPYFGGGDEFHPQNMETPLNFVANGIDLSTAANYASTIESELNVSEIELARVKRKMGARLNIFGECQLDEKFGECQIQYEYNF